MKFDQARISRDISLNLQANNSYWQLFSDSENGCLSLIGLGTVLFDGFQEVYFKLPNGFY